MSPVSRWCAADVAGLVKDRQARAVARGRLFGGWCRCWRMSGSTTWPQIEHHLGQPGPVSWSPCRSRYVRQPWQRGQFAGCFNVPVELGECARFLRITDVSQFVKE